MFLKLHHRAKGWRTYSEDKANSIAAALPTTSTIFKIHSIMIVADGSYVVWSDGTAQYLYFNVLLQIYIFHRKLVMEICFCMVN